MGVDDMLDDVQDELKRQLLQQCHTIAVVGLVERSSRPSNYVARYLQSQGYKIVPVNPKLQEVLGEKAYPDLESIPFKIDLVDIFRRSEEVHGIVQSAQAKNIPAVWVQPGILCSEETIQFVIEHHMLIIKDA
jgi:uncharacterized protein